MPALSYYTNVHNTALVILQKKGFRLWTENDGKDFYAEKDGWDFMAEDPVQLLGIIAIYEFHQPTQHKQYWWALNEPWLYDDLPEQKPQIELTDKSKKK